MDAEDDFDPTLFKKTKKKKKIFDPDATRGLETVDQVEFKEDVLIVDPKLEDDIMESDFSGKKKKKKKKICDLEEISETLSPVKETPDTEDEYFSLDLDFSTAKKKKKNKKKDLEQLVTEGPDKEEAAAKDDMPETSSSWANSDRDYTYDELLKRAFDVIFEKNPDLASGRKQKFIMRPPQVLRVGTKKTSFANFIDIAKALHRTPKHLLDFLLAELGTSGSMDGNQQLIIKGRFQAKQIENVLRRYIKEYVTCHTCRSPATILQKETRLFFLQCESCGSRCSVAGIKSGFQAVTGKRAAMRARAN